MSCLFPYFHLFNRYLTVNAHFDYLLMTGFEPRTSGIKISHIWAVVVTQLVERSLPTPEVHSSNPVIGKLFYQHLSVYCQLYWKDKNKEKEAGNGQFKKSHIWSKKNVQLVQGLIASFQNDKMFEDLPNGSFRLDTVHSGICCGLTFPQR